MGFGDGIWGYDLGGVTGTVAKPEWQGLESRFARSSDILLTLKYNIWILSLINSMIDL